MIVRKCDICGKEIMTGDFWDIVARYICYADVSEDRGKEVRIEICPECMKNNELYRYATKGG